MAWMHESNSWADNWLPRTSVRLLPMMDPPVGSCPVTI